MSENVARPTEDQVSVIVRFAVFHADMWAIDNARWEGSRAEFTRRMIDTTIRHLGELGLITLPPDIDELLDRPQPLGPVPSRWPAS